MMKVVCVNDVMCVVDSEYDSHLVDGEYESPLVGGYMVTQRMCLHRLNDYNECHILLYHYIQAPHGLVVHINDAKTYFHEHQ